MKKTDSEKRAWRKVRQMRRELKAELARKRTVALPVQGGVMGDEYEVKFTCASCQAPTSLVVRCSLSRVGG